MKLQRNFLSQLTKVVRGAHFEWQTTLKGGRALGAALLRVCHLRVGGLTFYWYSVIFRFAKFVQRLQRHSGWPYVVVYLKACAVLLQQSAGGMKIGNTRDLKSAVSRTGAGIPRIIPLQHRRAIVSGDIWTIRIWLTLFGLYRVIEFPGTLKLNSITSPSTIDVGYLRDWYGFLAAFWPVVVRTVRSGVRLQTNHVLYASKPERVTPTLLEALQDETPFEYSERLAAYVSRGGENPNLLNLKPRLLAILKGSPNTGGVRKPFYLSDKVKGTTTSIGAIFSDVGAWIGHGSWPHVSVNLYPFLQEWLSLVDDNVVTRLFELGRKVIQQVERTGNAQAFPGFGRTQGLGKLGFKVEPAGKTRVFAMVDCVTQMIMKPVHSVVFNILGTIPQDGTFNQLSPAKKLLEKVGPKGSFWSLDLSSATDRFPVVLQHAVMALLLGPKLAGLWVRLLTWRDFIVPPLPKGVTPPKEGVPGIVRYGAGQPMGALTSWGVFSLTHHILVQYCAYKVYGRLEWFTLYALLGDDIVLADEKVAKEYMHQLQVIGVECGLAKSLISSNGSFEFAKRTFIHGQDCSWISLKAVGAAQADLSVLEALLLIRGVDTLMVTLRIAAKFLGYGYRTLARLPAVLDSRCHLQGLTVLLTRPGSPWSSGVKNWLLQVRPGEVQDVPEGVLSVMGERLWSRLIDGLKGSLNAHLRGYSRVRLSDEYGTGATVMDPSNWHRNAWEYFILGNLLRDLKAELDAITKDALQISQPSLEDLERVWFSVMEWRDQLDELPVTPNLVDRAPEKFEGRKRSALLRLWRSLRRSLTKALTESKTSSDV